jgi:hypothetical protein
MPLAPIIMMGIFAAISVAIIFSEVAVPILTGLFFLTIAHAIAEPYWRIDRGRDKLEEEGYLVTRFENNWFSTRIDFEKQEEEYQIMGTLKEGGPVVAWEVDLDIFFEDGSEPKEEFGINDFHYEGRAGEKSIHDAVENIIQDAMNSYRTRGFGSRVVHSVGSTMKEKVEERAIENISAEELKEVEVEKGGKGVRYLVPYHYDSEFFDKEVKGNVYLDPEEYISLMARKTNCT